MIKKTVQPRKGLKVLDHLGRPIKKPVTVKVTTYYSRLINAGDLEEVPAGKKATNKNTKQEQ